MSEVILGIIILALIGFITWRERHFLEEKRQIMGFKLSQTATEFRLVTENPKKDKDEPKIPSDFVEEQSLSDEDFFEAIKKSNE